MTALHDLLVSNINENLSDHDSKNCIVCCPESHSNASESAGDNDDFTSESRTSDLNNQQPSSLINKFSSFSSVFKSKVRFLFIFVNFIKGKAVSCCHYC